MIYLDHRLAVVGFIGFIIVVIIIVINIVLIIIIIIIIIINKKTLQRTDFDIIFSLFCSFFILLIICSQTHYIFSLRVKRYNAPD